MLQLERIVRPLLDWYRQNARDLPWRRDPTPYRVWVSEIMLQQTRVEAVKGYFARFLAALPTPAALAAAPEGQLLKLWEGLGYYNRARNLQKAARILVERYGGQLPGDYEALLALPGVGRYTAGAVASIAFGLPEPAVDGNVLRVLSRLTADRSDIADPRTRQAAEQALRRVLPPGEPGSFNQALMELGALVCVPNGPPLCSRCPLAGLCQGRQEGIALDLPVKSSKKPRRVERRTILVVERDQLTAIRRRPARGLLAGMWELPSLEGEADARQAVEAVRGWGLEPLRVEPLGPSKHIFTHVEWQMTGFRVVAAEAGEAPGLVWAAPQQLRETYPLPSAFRYYLEPRRELE
ncbi:MAG TPA: A/G-specific adenine glycosylase [Candidatus Anaerotruncus excrementipullorum]|uniref:Adenine DNA glycosylase n=1 Tax=Candidatus Anaerotruncus excrementipullorum TaxID=2838465 RepID=A0A9D1WPS9_9FIRM|nr:A/G-specific adenine glycosylase [Candidatus Anaerotruncus excrementipullorum]